MEALRLIPVAKPDTNKLEEAYEVGADIEAVYKGTSVWVPACFQYDGASIPSAAWQLIGSPFHPRFMVAAVFHDWLYHTHQLDRDSADELFYDLLRASNVGKTKAVLMHGAVQNFGVWYWENDKDDLAYLKRLAKRIGQEGRDPAKYGL
ncbi:MAG: DUF1353 domain-containing protein [Desulfurivibrio sp.]|jgi:hypothetical protein|nr:MAG: DUF1353 domain-containing protein [Desulfurivibrio sp.]